MTFIASDPFKPAIKPTLPLDDPATNGVHDASATNGVHDAPATNGASHDAEPNGVDAPAPPKLDAAAYAASTPSTLLAAFIKIHNELDAYRHGAPVVVDGHTLSIAAVTAAARYGARVVLTHDDDVKHKVAASRAVIEDKVNKGASIYGVSTGFGGSADTRTDKTLLLGYALLQHQHSGVLPSSTTTPPPALPLLDPLASSSMPEAWVRAAILVRMNSLVRGHSGVRWELIERMGLLLERNIIPLVPLRGSISASGDLSPLSYIAGTISGNPSIRAFCGPPAAGPRTLLPAPAALSRAGIAPLPLLSKEHLGILNGTAFSAALGALAANDAAHLALLAQVCTALGTEALLGMRGNYHPFIHAAARPHPGQVEAAANISALLDGSRLAVDEEAEVSIADDSGKLRQDRYALRTAPQFLGPQLEDILSALRTLTLECNSTTDNPLIDAETGTVHHGGNFQAMAVTNCMERVRLALHHCGRLLFSQCAELIAPTMNRGLPPSLAATDPSLNYHCKGLDIATAAYVAELGFLANPVSTHIQSAEMHNQQVNSLALISARMTVDALDVLSILTASYLYVICQALDLRALQADFLAALAALLPPLLAAHFGGALPPADPAHARVLAGAVRAAEAAFEESATQDADARMRGVAARAGHVVVAHFAGRAPEDAGRALCALPAFTAALAAQAAARLRALRAEYLGGARGPCPASKYLGRGRAVYEYVRGALGVPMHGRENLGGFARGLGEEDATLGGNVSLIHEAIRDGKMQSVVVGLFE